MSSGRLHQPRRTADPDALEGLEWRKSRGHAWLDVGPSTVGEIAYERLPLDALIAMHRGVAAIDLATVDRPVLLVTSAGDDVVDPASSDLVADVVVRRCAARYGCAHSGHVASLDAERDLLQRQSSSSSRLPGSQMSVVVGVLAGRVIGDVA